MINLKYRLNYTFIAQGLNMGEKVSLPFRINPRCDTVDLSVSLVKSIELLNQVTV